MSLEQFNEQEQKLSLVLQEIVDMDLSYSDEKEFEEAARMDSVSRETSENAFLRIAKNLLKGNIPARTRGEPC